MKFVDPVIITDTEFTSSTVTEDDFAEWAVGSTYADGDKVISTTTHRIYESVQGSNTGNDPTTDDGTWWIDIAPTNRWAMFDFTVGTVSSATSEIDVEVTPNAVINSLALLDVHATNVRVRLGEDAAYDFGDSTTVSEPVYDGGDSTSTSFTTYFDGEYSFSDYESYDKTYTLGDQSGVTDWFGYFFEPVSLQSVLIVSDLPAFYDGTLRVTITGDNTVECGTMSIGQMIEIGTTQYGARVGIIDYSKKDTDVFGVTSVLERTYAKKVDANVWCENARVDFFTKKLADIRATPCVWIGDNDVGYESLVLFGFYKDWTTTVAYPTVSLCNLSIEGLT